MNTNRICGILLSLFLFASRGQAGSSSSTDYFITTDNVNAAGGSLSSADYGIVACAGVVVGTSTEATSAYMLKNGFAGQIYNFAGVVPTAASSSVNEGATLQLGVAQVLDDATFLPLAPAAASFSVSGSSGLFPATIDASGLLTAAAVFQNTPITVNAAWGGFNGTLALTITNTTDDNFGSYAADGLPDNWQVQYFGVNNPMAGPGRDANGTGQNNLFKYVAGLNPVDSTSKFILVLQPVSGRPTQKQIVFSPVLAGRTYTVLYKNSLIDATSTPLTGATQTNNGAQRTVTDTNAAGQTKFYKVQISMP